jgi:RecA/RadA recombinase
LQQKARELLSLQRGEQVEEAKMSGIMSADELRDYTYRSYPFDGKYKALIGQPARSFHMMVFGRPKQGKSIFCFQLAKYLTKFGKVLYIAAEEGFSATLQQKLTEFGAVNQNLYFANYRNFEQIRENLKGSDYEFVVIDSINFINLEPEDVETLKAENKEKAFITIQQATKNGAFRGSQQFAHNCDIIIEVVEGVANHTGRYAAPSEMQIFDKPNFKKNKAEDKPANQLQMFSESPGDF